MRINYQRTSRQLCFLSCALFFLLAALPLRVNSQLIPGPQKAAPAQAPVDEQVNVQTDLVSFVVTVTDSHGRSVAGLDKSVFAVTDDDKVQQISFFSDADAPVSIGIIFDLSGSMSEDRIERAREALSKFFESSDERDEYFLIGFNSNAKVLVDHTRDPNRIKSTLAEVKPHGDTALLDAVRLGVEEVTKGTHPKHALLLISDGDENRSRYTLKEVRRILEESDAVLYSICVNDTIRLASKAGFGIQTRLNTLSGVTGGKVFYPLSDARMNEAFDQIALELRHQYSIGYRPTGFVGNGKWHTVKVKVTQSQRDSPLVVRSRTGYYALTKVRDYEAGSR